MPLPVQRFLQDEHIILFSRMSFIKKMFFGTLRDFSICNNLNFLLKKNRGTLCGPAEAGSKKHGSRAGSAFYKVVRKGQTLLYRVKELRELAEKGCIGDSTGP